MQTAKNILVLTFAFALFACVPPAQNAVVATPSKAKAHSKEQKPATKGWDLLKQKAFSHLQVAPGWIDPELVPGKVNSLGWEDSAYIAADGNTLYFAYIPADLMGWLMYGHGKNFDRYQVGPIRGVFPKQSIDIFEARKVGNGFGAPKTFLYSKKRPRNPKIPYSEVGLVRDNKTGDWFYSANDPKPPADFDDDIYRNGKRLSPPITTDFDEGDPHFLNGELFFQSKDRPGNNGKQQIYFSKETKGGWTKPIKLNAPINLPQNDSWQAHLTTRGELYYSSNRSPKGQGPMNIYVSQRRGENRWGTPEQVISFKPGSGIAAVGEPTLTADGKWLYFVVVFVNDKKQHDCDIARVRRSN